MARQKIETKVPKQLKKNPAPSKNSAPLLLSPALLPPLPLYEMSRRNLKATRPHPLAEGAD